MGTERTQARVDNELIYDRGTFLGSVEDATSFQLGVSDTQVEVATDGATAVATIKLPNVGAARGKIYSIVGENDNSGEIHIELTGTAKSDVELTADGAVEALFYSDGRHWFELA